MEIRPAIKKRVALLGATSHIAKGLIACWADHQDRELFLYARSPERVREFVKSLGMSCGNILPIESFGEMTHDAVINCVGFGGPQKLLEGIDSILEITSRFDEMVLKFLEMNPEAQYINLSSGATYGVEFPQPVDEHSSARFNVNSLKLEESYGIAKLYVEAKHRFLPKYSIVDLRVFGYFSRYIDLTENFLLCKILNCLQMNQEFVTGPGDIRRDFVHPEDLTQLISLCLEHHPLNCAFDVYSAEPASKFQILEFFRSRFGLRYQVDDDFRATTVTGDKTHYYSRSRIALEIGYLPSYTTLETLGKEVHAILG